jgi:hypothetical protein
LSRGVQKTLTMWERKVLRGNMWYSKENANWRIRTYQELINLCRESDIISEIRKERLSRLRHVERMP